MISKTIVYLVYFLKTLQVMLELPLNLQVIAPGHQPNWDLVSDLVSSSYSHYFRSPLDCKKRFESCILKREEMCLTEIQNKKQQQLQQQQSNTKTKQPAKPAVIHFSFKGRGSPNFFSLF